MASDPPGARTGEEASQWFARLNQTAIRTDDLLAFRQWRADPANAVAYEEVERVWKRSGALSKDTAILAALDDAHRRTGAVKARPQLVRLTLAGGICGGVMVALIAAALIYAPLPFGWTTYVTQKGEQRTIALLDGSRVRLDTDSKIRVRYAKGLREVDLAQGQAFFDVVHRPDEPFIVHAGAATIRELGTRFDVRRRGREADITLVQGSVDVTNPHAPQRSVRMLAGQQLRTDAPRGASLTFANVDAATSWTSGRLVFDDIPLSDAVAEVNRYAAHPVRIEATDVGAVKVSGVFYTGDAVGFTQAVTSLYGLSQHQMADGSIALTHSTSDRPS